ncbi:MAG TPA: hypothetical protein VNT30_08025 [Stellaceae bacterium]|nr:hypothetical protein [Stellaceae bacterium]
MNSPTKGFSPFHAALRPTTDPTGFVTILRRGFNFSAANTSEWSFEDWELAVDAIDDEDGCGVAHPVGCDVIDPEATPHCESRFEGHGIWTLLALAYLRGRGAFKSGVSKTARPFRTVQIKEVNVPTGVGDTLEMQFRNGFDDALADAVSGGDRTPEWVRQAVHGPLMRSREERFGGHHPHHAGGRPHDHALAAHSR